MRRLLANLGLKLISLALAILVWLVVAGEKTSEVGMTVPVELQNLPRDLEVVGETVANVEVRLRATPAIVRRLDRQDVALRVDLHGVTEGEHIVHLSEQAVRRPFGVGVVRLNPSSLTLDLERTLTRDLPIKAHVVGAPAAGFEVAGIVSEPATVRLAGPRSRLQALTSVYTEAVPLDQARQDVTSSVNIGIGDPRVRIQGSPRVAVTVRVREQRGSRLFAGVPVDVRGGRGRLRPASVSITVAGPRSVLERITAAALRPYVDVAPRAWSGTRSVAVEVAPGFTGVEVTRVEPLQVVLAVPVTDPAPIRSGATQP